MAPTKGNPLDMPRATFDYIYHHLFLPHQLPGADDASPKSEASLLDFIHQSLQRFLPRRQDERAVKASISMIDLLRKSRSPQGHLKEAGVREVLQELLASAPVAVFQITDQNAGVLVSRKPDVVLLETFELSPTNEPAMGARGRLVRRFPANAVEVPLSDFEGEAFRGVLVKTLTRMSQQTVRETKSLSDKERPTPEKEKQEQDGVRETTDPKIVTELFTSMLRGCGKEVPVEGVCKHTREDIVWKNGKLPWRRSPLWLLVRVALHLSMLRLSGGDDKTYKEFMAFLMADALQAAGQQQKIASDVLHTMSTKVSRRLCKIQEPSDGPWLPHIRKIVRDSSETIHQRWKQICEREEPSLNLAKLSEFKMEESTDFSLANMEKFLDTIASRKTASSNRGFHPTSQINVEPQDQIPIAKYWNETNSPFNLFEIESWVANNLQAWVDQHMKRADSCVRDLKLLVEFYHAKAAIYYSDRPEGASRMILTIAELWCAADRVATHETPLLANYQPLVPTMVWQALLLSSKEEMQRLKHLEDYMHKRQKVAEELERPSIFSSFGLPGSFAVEFFSSSEQHQKIKYEIESEAARTRQEKREEFRRTKSEYISLMQKHASMECDVTTKKQRSTTILAHPSSCKRCRVEAKAKALAVHIHEWPLPRNDLEAQAAVFEMAAPVVFSEWRDLTIYFINDVLLSKPKHTSTPTTSYALRTYQPLKSWYTSQGHCRMHLRSEDQPNAIIHKRATPVESANESDVCLDSGLLYRYFDEKLNSFFSELVATEDLTELCTFKLPQRAETLSQYHHRSWKAPDGATPNEVIASQFACPEWLPLIEFKALAGLPYGHGIQWMSILAQLAMPKVDFNRPETAIFLLQMCLQSGPESTEVHRSTHAQLCDPTFGSKILESLTKCVLRVGENWESYVALWSFTCLTARVLSLTSADLSPPFLDLLQRSRETTHKWVEDLLQQAEDTSNEEQRKELLQTAFNLALVCADSFNVYDGHLSQILQDSAQASILVECSVIINDNAALKKEDDSIIQDVMLDRWKHLMYRARPILAEQNASGQSFLSDATQRRWRYFKRDSSWTMSPETNSWYQTTVAGLEVHLNILTGELLANGMPLSRLPTEYQLHCDYKRVFRDLLLHVMPSMAPGMAFCTTHLLYGYTVHFGVQGKDLLIRLENDEACLDYVPPRAFTGSLPDAFVNDYVHWYNNKTGFIEFFPHSQPYPNESAEWRLCRHEGLWKLCQGDSIFLLTPSSGLAQHISTILTHLESPLNLHMLYYKERSLLEIQIPRLQLRFFMNDGESVIRSQQFRDMHIDVDQSVGTLVGLRSKLVLRSSQEPPKRTLIIPEGEVDFKRQGTDGPLDHVIVSLKHGTARRVQAYQVDELLGRFVASTKLESKLFLAHLHALTSFCLPDSLLGRRGIEETLNILNSASVRAPTDWSPAASKLMEGIAALAPARQYYPETMKAMQTVVWSPHLSFSTQDDRLFTVAKQISQQSTVSDFLYPKAKDRLVSEPHTTMELAQRAISRDVGQFISGSDNGETGLHDETYLARDCTRSDRASRATEIATRAFRGDQGPSRLVAAGLASHLYKLMSAGKLSNHRGAPSKRDMEYDLMWLQRPDAWLSSYWCQLHSGFQQNQQWLHRMELVAWIATVAYSTENDEQITQALLMLALSPAVAAAPLPAGDAHDLSRGFILEPAVIEASAAFKSAARNGADGKAGARPKKAEGKTASQFQKDHGKEKRDAVNIYREKLTRQWPCQAPKPPGDYHMEAYIDVARSMKSVLPPWRMWWANKNFKEYLADFTAALQQIPMVAATEDGPFLAPTVSADYATEKNIPVIDIFGQKAPDTSSIPAQALENVVQKVEAEVGETEKLAQTIGILDSRASREYEQKYLDALRQSLSSFKTYSSNHLAQDKEFATLFRQHLEGCISRYELIYNALLTAVQPFSKSEPSSPGEYVAATLCTASFQPRVSPVFFLQQLKGANWTKLSAAWRDALVEYGLAVSALQKAKRLIRFQNDPVDLLRELENGDHAEWDPRENPEWLLLECESDIMIRPAQTQIARQMIHPPDGSNAVMQLNMGEGKSSVIVPIVSTALADGSKLVRVIAAKAQAKQMHQMLVAKLSGLLDRPVYQLPFSRDVQLDSEKAEAIRHLLRQCQNEGGVLLVQPEHLLSLQLMELELELSGHSSISQQIMQVRKFFDDSSRDIVDESDENLSVKFELTYTLGKQQALEHSPYRWIIAQEVLSLVRRFAAEVAAEFPLSMEFDDRHDERFPRIRILRRDAEKAIFERIADFICETGMTGFPIARQPPKIRNAARKYITKWELTAEECQDVENGQFWNETTANHILLLRGLLAGGVLAFALGRKRWRVNYGLDPTREKNTRLAVPYQAKDSPSARSEFSHPDIVIVLTCLTYYYGGLEDQALFDSLEILVRSDNAELEYSAWVHTAPTLPLAYKLLQGVNLRDRVQCSSTIFPHLRYSKGAIDYYLCRMVFNKSCQEFPHKLSASGWDLGKTKRCPTTGFSGTNDSRYVLPLGMKQLDLPEQSHTNALVLSNLLRPENSIATMPDEMAGTTFDSHSLLSLLLAGESKPRVILDVGAQIIDRTNIEMARAWLGHYESDENTQAVIFFNDLDEIMVLDKSGQVEELQTSPFADRLEQCLVFLDEVHTRGTDLRLPADYQAVVTLGAHVTKDRLAQACMRMRKLGRGQSVVFFVPREIEHDICLLRGDQGSAPSPNITVSDVLCWAITETCKDLRRAVPLWLNQGLRFTKQQALWDGLADPDNHVSRQDCAKQFMDEESQSLDKRYRPKQADADIASLINGLNSTVADEFRKRCSEFGLDALPEASFNEEQERELAPEKEMERVVERPPRVEPVEHQIHPGLHDFIANGVQTADPFLPAFMTLKTTSAANHLDVSEFSSNILVTQDFAATVNGALSLDTTADAFQKSVQWILTTQRDPSILVIVSPYEVQQLLPAIHQSLHTTLHIYSPRVNLGHEPIDDLNLYKVSQVQEAERQPIPRHAISCLGLFSGQLYLSSFGDYVQLCDALGLAWKPADDGVALGPDGFIPPGSSAAGGSSDIVNRSGFSKSPVRFLTVLIAKIRLDSEHFDKTHMGRILAGVRLLKSDFESM
ncbi:hypothetical protein LLEC1_04033 [Akanthomyces lecanii]|uniref:ubiquitinyl hydrolase 1 n=1 Tax=Cordyceps confragosa TaxID=2714763 RepID=A0A179IIJ5_CORDF|nr:hypothetical protein LLEC1_04033 [Akanthomyces lecanii]